MVASPYNCQLSTVNCPLSILQELGHLERSRFAAQPQDLRIGVALTVVSCVNYTVQALKKLTAQEVELTTADDKDDE